MLVKHFLILLFILFVSISCIKEDKEVLSVEDLCDNAGGNWNECSSECLGTGAAFCTEVCVAQCECGGIAGWKCPEGYTCRLSGDVVDELGVCVEVKK
jgi:hypothetical protein